MKLEQLVVHLKKPKSSSKWAHRWQLRILPDSSEWMVPRYTFCVCAKCLWITEEDKSLKRTNYSWLSSCWGRFAFDESLVTQVHLLKNDILKEIFWGAFVPRVGRDRFFFYYLGLLFSQQLKHCILVLFLLLLEEVFFKGKFSCAFA